MQRRASLIMLFSLAALGAWGDNVYWGFPTPLNRPGRFVQTASSDRLAVAVWQEFEPDGPDAIQGAFYFSLTSSRDGLAWTESPRRLGPFPYADKNKLYRKYSVAIDASDRILIAASTDDHTVTVFVSNDRGATFSEAARLQAAETVNVPLLSLSARRELLLFVTYLLKEEEGIYVARSVNGRDWTKLEPLVENTLVQPELPAHAVFRGKEYVVFQARRTKPTDFQLFMKMSGNGGASWNAAQPLTETMGMIDGEEVPAAQIVSQISNQRPFLLATKDALLVAWERSRTLPPRPPQAYVMPLTEDGRGQAKPEVRVSSGLGTVYNPRLVSHGDRIFAVWFENQSGQPTHVFFGAYDENGKNPAAIDLSPAVQGDSLFPQPVVLKGHLSLFWENQRTVRGRTDDRIFFIGPDRFTAPPPLAALNFTDRGAGRLPQLRFRWDIPQDSSGIKEFFWAKSSTPSIGIKDARPVPAGVYEETVDISGDGTWYLFVFAVDEAGNVSAPGQLVYTRDTVPPGRVRFIAPEPGPDGFLLSNTFLVAWSPPARDEIAGYSYRLRQLSSNQNNVSYSAAEFPAPEDTPSLKDPKVEFDNLDDGVWAIAVSAFDKAGNKGEAETLVFRLNRYQARTYITSVTATRDSSDRLLAVIRGRGFLAGGAVDLVVIDRDGAPPYDHEFRSSAGQFTVESDRVISGVPLDGLEEGVYQVGVHHPVRGFAFSGADTLKVEESGVVKYGNFSPPRPPFYQISRYLFTLSFTDIMVWLIVLALLAVFILAGRKVLALGREAAALNSEVSAFIQGGDLPMKETKKKIEALRRKGIGLRLKFTLLISLLALIIVVMVSLPISVAMIRIQQSSLAQKLKDEVNIVLSGVVDGTKTYLFINNSLLVSENLEKQYKQLPQAAEYAVVTGPRFINPRTGQTDLSGTDRLDVSSMERVWAVQPPDFSVPVASGSFTPIESEISDGISSRVPALAAEIDARARERVSDLDRAIDEATAERDRILFRTDKASLDRKAVLDQQIKDNTKQRDDELEKIARAYQGSLPEFNVDNVDLSVKSYVFYMPVVTRVPGYDHYFWGLARLGVSSDDISRQIQGSTQTLVGLTGGIALLALGLGLAGALLLASIIINPLRRLSRGVAVIRDTQDKSLLKDHLINVRTRDELRELADTVNQMTQGLVKAAIANKELMIGQEVQKMFIPLDAGPDGRKRTTGAMADANIDIFGYYEGAKVVSGDYFDFKRLDDRHFAIIKCDVAGKGVAGSLIMIEVATLFLAYFRDWSLKKQGLRIENLVFQINDMLEERGFTGRFAALSLCLLDSATGDCHFCHAGDKEVHVYRSGNMRCQTISLANTPAAGVFHSTMIPPQSGFKVERQKLEKGDTLFLFTDGLEEAKRLFRDGEFTPVLCSEPGLKEGETHGGTHVLGKESEELGLQRIEAIIEAVFSRGEYRLFKYHNPLADEELVFDFSGCEGTAEDAVLALASVEKIFRAYPDRAAVPEDVVRVDKKIDGFLERTFSGYRSYFKHRTEKPDEPDYVFYSGLKEDEQYDDLTILAIHKK
ncbi:MAG: SpoIIE family protein phosphatase [Spirochaetales bacterium]|nr:SpoIIE family protein phosphatase [Spirochaetales bacterium]